LGFEGEDLAAIIDMGKNPDYTSVTATFLRDQNSWIFLPESFQWLFPMTGKTLLPR